MEVSTFIAYMDLITGPLIIFYVLCTNKARYTNFFLRLGLLVAGFGLLGQSYAVIYGLDQLQGVGTIWLLKDVGLSIIAIVLFVKYVQTKVREIEWKKD